MGCKESDMTEQLHTLSFMLLVPKLLQFNLRSKICLHKWHTYKIFGFLTQEICMWVKEKIFEMYIQINEPYARKETVSKLEHFVEKC